LIHSLAPRKKGLARKTIGKLYVIEKISKSNHKSAEWLCQCECGNECIKTSLQLTSETIQSCGCINNRKNNGFKKIYKPGDTHYFLTIIGEGDKKGRLITYKCRCKCGNVVEYTIQQLRSLSFKSCGCREEYSRRSPKKIKYWGGLDYNPQP
jgi:hypothetical protein